MTVDRTLKRYTVGEEIFNSVSHGAGAALAIGGLVIMLVMSVAHGSALALGCSLVYGISLIILYTMSTLYHAVSQPKVKEILRIFDHTSIFVLIAGSYTPFCLIAMQGNSRGLAVVIAVWVCAVLGIILNAIDLKKTEKAGNRPVCDYGLVHRHRFPGYSCRPYRLRLSGCCFCGGISYTGGLVFYAMKNTKYMHSIWHLFVLAGSVLHYLCVVIYILPMTFA